MRIDVSVVDGVYGRPAAGMEVSVMHDTVAAPSGRSTGLTDSDGNFTCAIAADEDLTDGQNCTVRLDVDAYFASFGIAAGYKQVTLTVRAIDCEHEHRIVTVITPFMYTTWHVR